MHSRKMCRLLLMLLFDIRFVLYIIVFIVIFIMYICTKGSRVKICDNGNNYCIVVDFVLIYHMATMYYIVTVK